MKPTDTSKSNILKTVLAIGSRNAGSPISQQASGSSEKSEVLLNTKIKLTPPSLFGPFKAVREPTSIAAAETRWILILFLLLVSGIALGSIVGNMLAANAFP